MPTIKNVTVVGAGVLGSQIAYQAAFHGYKVTSYDVSAAALEGAATRFATLAQRYVADKVPGATGGHAEGTIREIHLTSDLGEAVADADLVIEAAPEILALKQELFAKLAGLAPEKTIFASNSSFLVPSAMKESTGRPDRFLNIHYANNVWLLNTAEIMGSEDTDPEVFDAVVQFAEGSGMVPIPLHKEQPGYVLNSLLNPLLMAAAGLLMKGIAEPDVIDKTWRVATNAPMGPFQIMDMIGMKTIYNVNHSSTDQADLAWADYLKTNYIDKGKLGAETGEGFYTY